MAAHHQITLRVMGRGRECYGTRDVQIRSHAMRFASAVRQAGAPLARP
jgi:hypothetical protein